nr:uncharacterized protein LOC107281846 isoform X2 [Oryza sativa Japonica Group]
MRGSSGEAGGVARTAAAPLLRRQGARRGGEGCQEHVHQEVLYVLQIEMRLFFLCELLSLLQLSSFPWSLLVEITCRGRQLLPILTLQHCC